MRGARVPNAGRDDAAMITKDFPADSEIIVNVGTPETEKGDDKLLNKGTVPPPKQPGRFLPRRQQNAVINFYDLGLINNGHGTYSTPVVNLPYANTAGTKIILNDILNHPVDTWKSRYFRIPHGSYGNNFGKFLNFDDNGYTLNDDEARWTANGFRMQSDDSDPVINLEVLTDNSRPEFWLRFDLLTLDYDSPSNITSNQIAPHFEDPFSPVSFSSKNPIDVFLVPIAISLVPIAPPILPPLNWQILNRGQLFDGTIPAHVYDTTDYNILHFPSVNNLLMWIIVQGSNIRYGWRS